jgi:hypothetical protein
MLRYYTCHTAWKRCSEILYALDTIDLKKYPSFDILSIGCGAAPDLMAFELAAGGRQVRYHGIDIASEWDEIHNCIEWSADWENCVTAKFEQGDVYEMFASPVALTEPYNVIVLQYMIAGHVYSDRADRIEDLFECVINRLVANKRADSPMLIIINDIDHKSWICDYFNLLTRKLHRYGYTFRATKRHFEKREDGENNGSILYKSNSSRFLQIIPSDHREKYNSHAPCSAAQLIIEVE